MGRIESFLRRRWRGLTIAIVAFGVGWAFGAAGSSETPSASTSPPPPPSEREPPPPPPPAPPPPPPVTPNPDAHLEGQCDYVLGDFTEGASGFRFIAGADIENTGNIGAVVRVTVTWNQLGDAPIKMVKRVKVWPTASRSVQFKKVASQDQIDLHQSANGKCDVAATIVDTFGEPIE
jgi:hypothetical protein